MDSAQHAWPALLRGETADHSTRLRADAVAGPRHSRRPGLYAGALSQMEGIGGHHIQPHMPLHEAYLGLKYFTFMRDPLKMRASMYQHGINTLGEANCILEEWRQEEQSQNGRPR
jgi:hypothetical protein